MADNSFFTEVEMQRLAQVELYNARGHYDRITWKPDNHEQLQQASETCGEASDEQLLKLAEQNIFESTNGNGTPPEIDLTSPNGEVKPPVSPPKSKPKKVVIQENDFTEPPRQENEPPKLTGITAYDLSKKEIPDVKWFVEGLLPEGLTILAGDAKIGKSFLAWNIALAVASEGMALSKINVESSHNVVYLAMEDPEKLLQERLHLMCPDGVPNNVHIVDNFLALKFDSDGLKVLGDYLDETQSEILIVDTWGHVKPNPQLMNGTSYDTDYAGLMPVQRFAHERNIAVILVTHTTKGKNVENQFNDIQGSMGMQAGCDTMMILARDQGSHVLRIKGRRIMETEYAMTLNDGIWVLEGDAEEFNMSDERKDLLELIRESGVDGLKVKDLVELTGKSQPLVSKLLKKMVAEGVIVRPQSRGNYFIP